MKHIAQSIFHARIVLCSLLFSLTLTIPRPNELYVISIHNANVADEARTNQQQQPRKIAVQNAPIYPHTHTHTKPEKESKNEKNKEIILA